MNYYKRHLGDYAKSLSNLSQGQIGAYDLLLDWHYANERPLPLDSRELYIIGRCQSKAERDNVDRVLLYFIRTDEGYIQKRAVEEMEKYAARCEKNRQVGRLGGRPPASETDSETETQTVSESVSKKNPSQNPIAIKEQKQTSLGQQAARFEDFWTVYPVKKGKSDALRAWKRKGLDAIADRIITDVLARAAGDRQWLDGFIPHGSTYVNAEGWQDAIEPPKGRATAAAYVPMPGEV